jgi:hypothetical protein
MTTKYMDATMETPFATVQGAHREGTQAKV